MQRLDQLQQQIADYKTPPVHLWNPTLVGEIDIQIDVMCNWIHEGGPITRVELVRLFSSILWYEDENYYLVTPAEKLKIQVTDVPFEVQQMEYVENHWVATINTSEMIVVDHQHPVELREYNGNQIPYVKVRYDLWARINRSIYYQWATQAMDHIESGELILMSGEYPIYLGGVES